MNDLGFWPKLLLAVLAAWRITHLLAREDGPADLLVRLRRWVGDGFLGKLMDCFYCLSLWVAAPLAFYVSRGPVDWLLTWLAISGAASLLERLGQEPVVIQPLSQSAEGETEDGMLWSETNRDQGRIASGDKRDLNAARDGADDRASAARDQ